MQPREDKAILLCGRILALDLEEACPSQDVRYSDLPTAAMVVEGLGTINQLLLCLQRRVLSQGLSHTCVSVGDRKSNSTAGTESCFICAAGCNNHHSTGSAMQLPAHPLGVTWKWLHVPGRQRRKTWSQRPGMSWLPETFLLMPARNPSPPGDWLRCLPKVRFVFNTHNPPLFQVV